MKANLVDNKDTAIHNHDRLGKVIMDIVYAMKSDMEPKVLEYYLQRDDH